MDFSTGATNDYRYEKEGILCQYLLFHYGSKKDQMPLDLNLQTALDFPARCVWECLDVKVLPKSSRALELGCSVGRSSFELSRYCESVLAIDSSKIFISAAKQIQETGQKEYALTIEGAQKQKRIALLPEGVRPEKIKFRCDDALNVSKKDFAFDVVLVANLLCRMSNPLALLTELPHLTAVNSQLILISPYSWSTEFTPLGNWLGGKESSQGKNSLDDIQNALRDYFDLKRVFDMPFLIREHARKYEVGISQATIWTRH